MIHVTVQTKGGVGKSAIASQLLTSYIYVNTQKPVQYFEIDDQNQSIRTLAASTIIDAKLISTENLAKFAEESIMFEDDAIIDVGGNLTATMFLQKLKVLGGFLAPTTFYIPLTDSDQDAINAANTFNLIREFDKNSKIIYVLNKCTNKSNTELLEREFINYYGSDVLDVLPIVKDDRTDMIALNRHHIYGIIGKLQKTIIELGQDDYEEPYRTVAQEFFKDKTNQPLYKELRRLMFLKEQTTIAKQIFKDEYLELFAQITQITKA